MISGSQKFARVCKSLPEFAKLELNLKLKLTLELKLKLDLKLELKLGLKLRLMRRLRLKLGSTRQDEEPLRNWHFSTETAGDVPYFPCLGFSDPSYLGPRSLQEFARVCKSF